MVHSSNSANPEDCAETLSTNAANDTVYVVKHDTVYVEKPLQEAVIPTTQTTVNGNVPFIVARNYFVRNDSGFQGSKLITTAEEFESIFGKAATKRCPAHVSALQ